MYVLPFAHILHYVQREHILSQRDNNGVVSWGNPYIEISEWGSTHK